MNIAIVGYGGFAREVAYQIWSDFPEAEIKFYVDKDYADGKNCFPLRDIKTLEQKVLIAIGDPQLRQDVLFRLPAGVKFTKFIHSSVQIHDKVKVRIGDGSIICAGCILTTNIIVGKHCHLNLQTSIGHDTSIGNFVTTAPKVSISGNCKIDSKVYFGTNSAVKEKIKIAPNTTIGMGAMVVKDIHNPNETWVGVPARKLHR